MRINKLLLILVLLFGVGSFAARTVKVTTPIGQPFQLSNPSNATVTYDLQCFDTSGASIINLSGQTLSANQTKSFGKTEKCVGGATPVNSSTITSVGLIRCAGSTNFANAITRCDSFYSLCKYDQLLNNGSVNDADYWFDKDTGALEVATSSGIFNPATGGNEASTDTNFNKQCRRSGAVITYCRENLPTATLSGTLCCPGTDSPICSVTITSTTGFLSSPQFKGGAPF